MDHRGSLYSNRRGIGEGVDTDGIQLNSNPSTPTSRTHIRVCYLICSLTSVRSIFPTGLIDENCRVESVSQFWSLYSIKIVTYLVRYGYSLPGRSLNTLRYRLRTTCEVALTNRLFDIGPISSTFAARNKQVGLISSGSHDDRVFFK